MAIDPVKIPQNVYVEDRIIGPVTLKQLIIVGFGAGFSYVLYAMASKAGPPGLPLTIALWSPTAVAASFAFLKINDLSLFNIILLMIEHMNKPPVRRWTPHPGISINIVTHPTKEAPAQEKVKDTHSQKLEEMTKKLESQQIELTKLMAAIPNSINQKNLVSPVPSTASTETVDGISADANAAPVQTAPKEIVADETPTAPKPVNPNRVSVQGLDPLRSVDGLSDLHAYQHLFRTPA